MTRRYRKQSVFLLLLTAVVGVTVIIGAARRNSVGCIARAVGTNVSGVSVWVTRGSSPGLYYPSRLHWEWDRACKRLSLPFKRGSTYIGILTNTPTPGSDVLWVEIAYREKLFMGRLVAEEVDDGGRIHRRSTAYHLIGSTQRIIAVATYPLVGGADRYRGKTIHIRESFWPPERNWPVERNWPPSSSAEWLTPASSGNGVDGSPGQAGSGSATRSTLQPDEACCDS
jgi:hypothetical protein